MTAKTNSPRAASLGSLVSLAYQGILILFFVYTLANKSMNYADFEINLQKTGLYSLEMITPVAWGALISEVIAIGLLVYNSLWGYRFTLLMMSVFTGYICILYTLGRYEVCGCGGILNGLPFYSHLAINISIIISLLVALVYEKINQSHSQGA